MSQFLFFYNRTGPILYFPSQKNTGSLFRKLPLSHLSDIVIDKLKTLVSSCDLIFPDKEINSKPNRFIAKIECEDPEIIGSGLCSFVQNEYRRICEDIVAKLNLCVPEGFDQQIDYLLTCTGSHWILKKENTLQNLVSLKVI